MNNIERIYNHKGPVVIDIETPGQVDPYAPDARVLMIGVALSPTEAYVFSTEDDIQPLLKALELKPLIAHNAKFERNWLRKAYGFEGRFSVDTMLLAHYVNEKQPTGLETLAQEFFDAPPYGENIDYVNEPWESTQRTALMIVNTHTGCMSYGSIEPQTPISILSWSFLGLFGIWSTTALASVWQLTRACTHIFLI